MRSYLNLVAFSHTIFALPFALVGFTLATLESGHGLSLKTLVLVVLCMVFARSAAMAFNRWLDRAIDAKNPRTAVREIPSGKITPNAALALTVGSALAFWATTWWINWQCFLLAPVALLVVLGYSYTKRFTALCHLVLGLGLSLAPIGAWLAVGLDWDLLPLTYSLAVLFWVSGFDIIYAIQDEAFDKSQSLKSIPSWLGAHRALMLSNGLHVLSGCFLLFAAWQQTQRYPAFGWLHWVGAAIFLMLLIYQHTLVKADDLSKVNRAFFTTNGIASVVFGTFLIVDAII